MNAGQANTWERSQQAIDVEIESLKESIRALKSRRNAFSPISSLPPEVFAVIFSFSCLPGRSSLDGKPFHLARLFVSHVCHRWRQMALDQPLLWSHVDFTALSLAAATETLVRAKSAPLHLEANFSDHRWDDVRSSAFRKELQARILHVRHLRISAKPTHLLRTLERFVSPAPTLQHLSLSSHRQHQNRRIGRRLFIPDTLFDGSTPRLSCLELRNCNICWKSPLLKGLNRLEIFTPSLNARPKLADWLGALDEMPQLTTLTLHSASPIAPPLPFEVQRTVTLPSLTHLDILASLGDHAFALAHLDLPALTWLCLTTLSSRLPNSSEVQKLLTYIAQHAHGSQDTVPLQSVYVHSKDDHVDILAWSVPNIDAEADDPPTLLATTLPTRVALSIRNNGWLDAYKRLNILNMVMESLPLDSLVTLAAQDLSGNPNDQGLQTQHFWSPRSLEWPLLQRVRLAPPAAHGFMLMMLEDNGGREVPRLPSLTELVVVDYSLYELSLLPLRDALMKRVEQGIPVKTLDLRMCVPDLDAPVEDWFLSLSELAVNVLGPETSETREQMESMWETVARGPFVDIYDSREDNNSESSDTGSDDEEEVE